MIKLNKKLAFTLAETLICITIVGILATIMVTSYAPKEKTTRFLYANAYTGVSDAFYNVMLHKQQESGNKNPFKVNQAGINAGPKVLCEEMVKYINTSSVSCANNKKTSALGNSFSDENVQFTSENGMKFYFSEMFTTSYEQGEPDENGVKPEITVNYFIAFVDINGDRRPNTMEYSGELDTNGLGENLPDIFAFALMDNGRTVPIGHVELDNRILLTRVAYYNRGAEVMYAEPSQALYLSKNGAWGRYEETWDDDDEFAELYREPSIPLTMGETIRDSLPNGSLMKINIPTPKNDLYESKDGTQCTMYDIDNCYVVIDKYRY